MLICSSWRIIKTSGRSGNIEDFIAIDKAVRTFMYDET
jgi:hypothetical protein